MDTDYTIPHLFDNPKQDIARLQELTATFLFESIGATYLPKRYLDLIKRHDAFHAIRIYLNYLNLTYEELLATENARTLYRAMEDELVEAEAYFDNVELPDAPLFAALATHDPLVWRGCIKKLRKVHSVLLTLKSRRIDLFDFHAFMKQAEHDLKAWHRLPDGDLDSMYVMYSNWLIAEASFHEQQRLINLAIDQIQAFAPLPDLLAEAFAQSLNRRDDAVASALDGSLSIDEILAALSESLEDLNAIIEACADPSPPPSTPPPPHRSPDADLIVAITNEFKQMFDEVLASDPTLGKHGAATTTYRALAKKYHPDKNGEEMTRHFQILAEVHETYKTV